MKFERIKGGEAVAGSGRRRMIIVIAAVVVIGALAWWLLSGSSLPAGFASGNGRLEANEVYIAAKYPGRIREVLVNEGDIVQRGQVVARMDVDELEARLRQAEAQVREAEDAQRIAYAEVAARGSQVGARRGRSNPRPDPRLRARRADARPGGEPSRRGRRGARRRRPGLLDRRSSRRLYVRLPARGGDRADRQRLRGSDRARRGAAIPHPRLRLLHLADCAIHAQGGRDRRGAAQPHLPREAPDPARPARPI